MIRLPPTGIDISQKDLNFHMQQLDIYQGLLQQGFKQKEIIRYFKEQDIKLGVIGLEAGDNASDQQYEELCERTGVTQMRLKVVDSSPDPVQLNTNVSVSPERLAMPNDNTQFAVEPSSTRISKEHAYSPRQSSLLRFARAISSGYSSECSDSDVRCPFFPRGNITYRPRSNTYSYDQSEIDENDLSNDFKTSILDLQHLSLDEDLVPVSDVSNRTVLRGASNLRPEAASFTPLSLQFGLGCESPKGKEETESSSDTNGASLPSSPPLLPVHSRSKLRSPSLPRVYPTLAQTESRSPSVSHKHLHQQYLDGSFAIYDDSVPPQFQPQTPADLHQGRLLGHHDAAYTAPPGMVRSSMMSPGRYLHGTRQPSGDMSPTSRALLIRERRRREFDRGARVEELRVNRTHDAHVSAQEDMAIVAQNLWRDDFDADVVGDENFEDVTLAGAARRLRTMSGNRRGY